MDGTALRILSCQLHAEAALYQNIGPHYPLVANWIVTNAGLCRREGKLSDCVGNRTLAAQPVYNNLSDNQSGSNTLSDRTSPVLIPFLTGPVRF